MTDVVFYIILLSYGFCLGILALYAALQLYLSQRALKYSHPKLPQIGADHWPSVTVQLPVYNEKYVVERLLISVFALDYPRDQLEIQILDDSTDETSLIIERICKENGRDGIAVKHLRRHERLGFKAGALAWGLERATGAFIAIFDADFCPPPEFLRETIPYFKDAEVALVQTRWGHSNPDDNLLTQLQAFGLDAHFGVEQRGRFAAGVYFNFNGTAGIWRKTAIAAAGGWQADTLTEDLDLSYRAQKLGWKFVYVHSVIAPAELPADIWAIAGQQFRWTKGAAQNARKHLPALLSTGHLPFTLRLHSLVHLGNSTVFVIMFLSVLLSVALFLHVVQKPASILWLQMGWIFMPTLGMLGVAYYRGQVRSDSKFLLRYLMFLSFYMGLSLRIAKAVAEGYILKGGYFNRTPKGRVERNTYRKAHLVGIFMWPEALFSLIFMLLSVWSIYTALWGFTPLFLMLSIGFGTVSGYSLKRFKPLGAQERY